MQLQIRTRVEIVNQYSFFTEEYHMKRMLDRVRPKLQEGKLGYILLWALGVPIPVLFVIYLLRGCT